MQILFIFIYNFEWKINCAYRFEHRNVFFVKWCFSSEVIVLCNRLKGEKRCISRDDVVLGRFGCTVVLFSTSMANCWLILLLRPLHIKKHIVNTKLSQIINLAGIHNLSKHSVHSNFSSFSICLRYFINKITEKLMNTFYSDGIIIIAI